MGICSIDLQSLTKTLVSTPCSKPRFIMYVFIYLCLFCFETGSQLPLADPEEDDLELLTSPNSLSQVQANSTMPGLYAPGMEFRSLRPHPREATSAQLFMASPGLCHGTTSLDFKAARFSYFHSFHNGSQGSNSWVFSRNWGK